MIAPTLMAMSHALRALALRAPVLQALAQRPASLAPASDSAIRAATEAIFRDPAYRPAGPSARVWQWLFGQLGELLAALLPAWRAVRANPVLYWSLLAILTLLALALLARLTAAYLPGQSETAHLPGGTARRGGRDPWLAAQEAAGQGDFTAAAHALYLALLEAAAHRGAIRPHPSKTAGDYVRELRSSGSALLAPFRDFTRSYEVVIYGHGWCDGARYEHLRAIALPLLRAPRG